MRVTVFRQEKTIDEVVTRVFGDLPPAERELAVNHLLKFNPQLGSLESLPEGAVLVIPAAAGLKVRREGGTTEPAAELVETVAAALAAYRQRLASAAEAETADATATLRLLKSARLKKLVDTFADELRPAAARVAVATEERRKNAETLRGSLRFETETLQKELAELADKLR